MVVRVLMVLLAILATGCAELPPQPEPEPPPVREVPPPESPAPIESQPAVPPPAPVQAETPAPVVEEPLRDSIAIVLSNRTPAFENVATSLSALLDDYLLYNLADKSLAPPAVFAGIADSPTQVVVAIGLDAAREAILRSTVPVVFCQVFNIGDSHDTRVPVKGVASIPPLELQVAAWKTLNPGLKTIGAILGSGHDDLIDEAKQATALHDIDMNYRITDSDRETLFAFERMAPAIDGFWLFPDNRVLSLEILHEMLDYAARHHVQVAVFNDAFLQMGATVSSTTVDTDIAETVLSVATRLARDDSADLPYITPLNEVRMRTSAQQEEIEVAPESVGHNGTGGVP